MFFSWNKNTLYAKITSYFLVLNKSFSKNTINYNPTLNMHINTTTKSLSPNKIIIFLLKNHPSFGDFSHPFTHLHRALETLWFPPFASSSSGPQTSTPTQPPRRSHCPRFIKASAGRLGQKPMSFWPTKNASKIDHARWWWWNLWRHYGFLWRILSDAKIDNNLRTSKLHSCWFRKNAD